MQPRHAPSAPSAETTGEVPSVRHPAEPSEVDAAVPAKRVWFDLLDSLPAAAAPTAVKMESEAVGEERVLKSRRAISGDTLNLIGAIQPNEEESDEQ